MRPPRRRIAFILASTNHGTMILNRFDYRMTEPGKGYGAGFMLLNTSEFDMEEARVVIALLRPDAHHWGDNHSQLQAAGEQNSDPDERVPAEGFDPETSGDQCRPDKVAPADQNLVGKGDNGCPDT